MKPILFFGKGELVSIDPQNILCVKADKRYSEVYEKNTAPDGKPFITHTACIHLGGFEKKLPSSMFARTSRQMVVNVYLVKAIGEGAVKLHVDIEQSIVIGKGYRDRFMRKFNHIK